MSFKCTYGSFKRVLNDMHGFLPSSREKEINLDRAQSQTKAPPPITMFDRLRRPSQSDEPRLAVDMEPLSLQSHMRSQTLVHAQEQVGQGGPRIAPFETEKSEAEALSEKRLYARRKRRHEEALGTYTQEAKTDQLFNKEVTDAALEWSDGLRQPGTDLREYVKLVTPAGKLTKEVAKDLLQRMKLPVKTEMGVMLHYVQALFLRFRDFVT